jgi:thiol-disulfide isomerase/thioredoxin
VNCWCRYIWLAGLSMMLGCGLFPKNNSTSTPPPKNDRIPATGLTSQNPRATQNGILAGQVIDDVNQRKGGVAITVQSLDGTDTKQAISNDQGYFTIQGLQPSKKYKLVASARSGNLQLSGATEATTPNVVVLIKLSESRQESGGKPTALSGSVGGLHSSIAEPSGQGNFSQSPINPNPASTGRGDRLGPASDLNQPPASAPGNPRLGRPITNEPGEPRADVPARPDYITQTSPLPRSDPPTFMTIPGPGANRADQAPGNSGPGSDGRYFNHPLLDMDQRPTSLSAYRGRLTLVDVWGTWCFPCIRALPELTALKGRYAEKGLVVVGITVRGPDEKGDIPSRIEAIRFITERRNPVNYPILLEQEAQPIKDVFQIKLIPTLILLDESGREVWRGEGSSEQTRRQLEQELQRRLK